MNANGTALWLVGWGRKRGEEVQRMALNATAAGLGTDFSMAAEGLLRYVMSETSSQKFSSEAIISENKCFRRKRYGFSHCCWAFSLQEPLMPFSVSSQSTKSELCPPPLGGPPASHPRSSHGCYLSGTVPLGAMCPPHVLKPCRARGNGALSRLWH